MASASSNTNFDKKMRWLKNRPAVAFVLLGGVIVMAIGQFTGALDSIISFTEKRFIKPSAWKVQVYHFHNWSNEAGSQRLGERFSGLILDQLLKRDLDAQGGEEIPQGAPFDVVSWRGSPDELEETYSMMAPFIAVTGYVEENDNQPDFLVHIRVSAVYQDLRIEPLMLNELRIEAAGHDMRKKADVVAHGIYEAAQDLAQASED